VRIETFQMERMQCLYEYEVEYNLSESGVEPLRVGELLGGDDRARAFLEQPLLYAESTGSPALREHIAAFYPGAEPENVTVMNGGSEVNFIALWTLLDGGKGDRLACMLPNYLQGWGLGRHFGAGSDAFRLKPRGTGADRRWALDVDELDRAVTRDTRVILVTNPNNPTGAVLTEEEMDAVVRAARRARAWIVADEIYRGAEVHGSTSPTFWGRYDRVIVTAGLSKAFGLPGLRTGWAVAPPKMIAELWRRHDYTTLSPGTLSERLATIAMEPVRREQLLERTRGILRTNLPVLEDWIRDREDVFSYVEPVAGAIAYVGYRLPVRSTALVDRLRREQSVLLVPGEQFGMGKYLRIGYGGDVEYAMKGMERVDATLRRLGAKAR
jgi:aspartate/methionine/tyrosine aminotransferase